MYSERDKSQIFVECLPLLTSGQARLVESKKLAMRVRLRAGSADER